MKTKLNPEWCRLLKVLSDGAWYTRALFVPSRPISERTVNACIGQGFVKIKRKILKRESPDSSEVYQTAYCITALGKKALATGQY